MVNKKVVTTLCLALSISFVCTGCFKKKDTLQINENIKETNVSKVVQPKSVEKKYDLYSTTPYDLPLFSIVEISKLPASVKSTIDKILEEAQGFYFLRNEPDGVLIIMQNPIKQGDVYSRHDLQFAKIMPDGTVIYHSAGYSGIDGETNSDTTKDNSWIYDEKSEIKRPLKHIAYDEKGKIKFTEIWNYEEQEPVKYQMKDAKKRTVSILKEFQDTDTEYRREHVFYDTEGNTIMSFSVNYEGANISRLNFYNSHELIDSVSILSEYSDGLKTKELIYNDSYELVNTVLSEYTNDERKNIKLLDKDGNEICKISS